MSQARTRSSPSTLSPAKRFGIIPVRPARVWLAMRALAAPRTGDKPAMDTDTIRRVEPDAGCAELGVQAPKPFRVPDWKIDGTNRHEMQRQRAEGDEERPGDIPGDAQ